MVVSEYRIGHSIGVIFVAVLIYIAGCTGSNLKSITIRGSDTVLPVAQALSEEYMKNNPDIDISVTGGGSGVGIASFISGECDISTSSRELKPEEELKLKNKNILYEKISVAIDGMVIIVNKENPVDKLTLAQLKDIYAGKITNWKDVGGDDRKIVIYERETSSGTYEVFREKVMEGDNVIATALSKPSNGAIVAAVEGNPSAVGYVGLAYADPQKVKILKISADGVNYYEPTQENILSHKYTLWRYLYMIKRKDAPEHVNRFIEYVKGEQGEGIVKKIGYVPVKPIK